MAPAIQYISDESWSVRLHIGARRWRNRFITVGLALLITAVCGWSVVGAFEQVQAPSLLELAVPGSVAAVLVIFSIFLMCSALQVDSSSPLTDRSKKQLITTLKRFNAERFGVSRSEKKRQHMAETAVQAIARALSEHDRVNAEMEDAPNSPLLDRLHAKALDRESHNLATGLRDFDMAVPADS